MPDTILKTNELTKKYEGTFAADHISMELNRGDIYGFIGVNGAGKTTFLRMLCGLSKPDQGSIALFGASCGKELLTARKKIGSLIEHPAFYPNMSAMDNLEIQMRNLGIAPRKSRQMPEELLHLVGLENTRGQKAGTFSLDMKQRLGLAIALIGNPELLILDEPASNLDPAGIAELRELLGRLNRERHITILFSSQELSEPEGLATRYGFLHQGKLKQELTAEQLEADCRIHGFDPEKYFQSLLTEWKAG